MVQFDLDSTFNKIIHIYRRQCPTWAGPQHHIQPYRIYRRQYAHEALLVAHYTWWRYDRSTLALLNHIAFVEGMLQSRS